MRRKQANNIVIGDLVAENKNAWNEAERLGLVLEVYKSATRGPPWARVLWLSRGNTNFVLRSVELGHHQWTHWAGNSAGQFKGVVVTHAPRNRALTKKWLKELKYVDALCRGIRKAGAK